MITPFYALLGLLVVAVAIGFFLIRSLARGAPSISVNEGRRYWAFIVILGGCIVFTIFAAIGVYIVRNDVKLSFYLALAAHAQLFVGMGTFGFVLGRRMRFKGGATGIDFDDTEGPQTPAEGAAAAVGAAQKVADKLEEKE